MKKRPGFAGAFFRSASSAEDVIASGSDLADRTVDHLRRLFARGDRNAAGNLPERVP
jgi:hypothetical protein